MSNSRHSGLRGATTTVALLIDAPVIGEAEARRRTLSLWSSGASLRVLPDGRLLLRLAAPVELRAEHAAGLTVTDDDGVLLAGGAVRGADAVPGDLVECRHGIVVRTAVAALPIVDVSGWVDLGRRNLVVVVPLDTGVVERAIEIVAPPAPPDLRGGARIAPRPADVETLDGRGVARGGRRARTSPGEGAGAGRRQGDLLARLVLRTPAADVLGRRHARYLRQLTRAFERGDDERALRDAVGVGGAAGSQWLSLRLPRPRRGDLTPAPHRSGGPAVPWGGSAQEHLTSLYRRAAERLEHSGEIERAAFVHADLLDAPRDAVALLERHRVFALAARLADGRELDPELVVRLWWRAGDRARAVDVARAHGVFAGAVCLLESVDGQAALELRSEWVAAERAKHDHLAAVEAAWPAPELRVGIAPDLDALTAAGGPMALRALALRLAWRPDEEAFAAAARILSDHQSTPDGLDDRGVLASALAERSAVDPVADHRLAGLAVRAVLRDGARWGGPGPRKDLVARLRPRLEPVLRADLPAIPSAAESPAVPLVALPAEPGRVAIHDAVALPNGVLVAAGERGVLLLGHDGRPRARWPTPADHLVVADHGAVVLASLRGESLTEIHRLDVAARRATPWAALAQAVLLPSFDGGTAVAVMPGALRGIDVLSSAPRVLWSELDADATVRSVTRSPRWLSAIVNAPLLGRRDQRVDEHWTWSLPSRRLVARRVLSDGDWFSGCVVTADGTLLSIEEGDRGPVERGNDAHGRRLHRTARPPEGTTLAVDGEHTAWATADPNGARLVLRSGEGLGSVAVVAAPGVEQLGFRVHDGVATVWTDDGRIAGVDLRSRRVVALLRTHG